MPGLFIGKSNMAVFGFSHSDGIFPVLIGAGSRDPVFILFGGVGIPEQISLGCGIPVLNLAGFGGRELGNI